MQVQNRKKLIVIHGWGGTYADAADRIGDLLDFECFWDSGTFMVPRRIATMIRHLLNVPNPDRHILALQQLTLSRFLASDVDAPSAHDAHKDAFAGFSEARLRDDFAHLGLPVSPLARRRRAAQLRETAERALAPIQSVIRELQDAWRDNSTGSQTEQDARDLIDERSKAAGLNESLLPLLEMLREMHETGGDLDTVASAAFYAHWMVNKARQEGNELLYGRDYLFVFVNYHEPLTQMRQYAPAELYLADLPVGAFPSVEADIRTLCDQAVFAARYEDHHPYTAERKAQLDELVAEGKLGYLALSGPLQGSELPEDEEPQCAADMVYTATIAGEPCDCAGAKRLREAAHGEDFVTNRTELGILLTNLIKGGICKTELAQILVEAMQSDDAIERLEKRGWAQLPDQWHADIEEVAETLADNATQLTLAENHTQIIAALATHAPPGKPKLPTGKAIEFFARQFPDADYVFYCFGSSLMVARRLNHADTALNLGALMPALGTEADGGHSGAAVCRPDANPNYPTHLLGRVRATNFQRFSHYLADRLADNGYAVESIKDISAASQHRMRRGRHNITVVLLLALLLGLALTIAFPAFRPKQVRESNSDFFPQIKVDEPAIAEEAAP